MPRFLLETVIAVSFLFQIGGSAAHAQEWRARFESEGLKAMAEIEANCDQLDGEIQHQYSDKPYPYQTTKFLIRKPWIQVLNECEQTRTKEFEGKGLPVAWAWGRNSRYSFSLTRGSANSPFLLRGCTTPSERIDVNTDTLLNYSVNASWKFAGKAVREWFKTETFSVKSVGPVMREGKSLARLEVAYTKNQQQPKAFEVSAFVGELFLDPENHWAVSSFVQKSQEWENGVPRVYYVEEANVEYGPPIDRMPMPKVVRTKGQTVPKDTNAKSYVDTVSHTITKLVRRVPSEREFSISAFGIPEVVPEGFPEERSPIWIWLIGIAVVLGVGAVLVRWRGFQRPVVPRQPSNN